MCSFYEGVENATITNSRPHPTVIAMNTDNYNTDNTL